jgi:hypothetical protein
MSIALWLMLPEPSQWQFWGWLDRSLQLGLVVMSGLLAYLAGHLLLGARIKDFYNPKQP